MVTPNAAPCLFLSHSGADTEAARELKRRLLASPDARAARLTIWLDKDDLPAGAGWQAELEKAIEAKNNAQFAAAFDALTDGCNSCHTNAGKPFIRIQRPSELPVSNQNFTPAK